ncbi:MAG: hypothetical protein HYZ54_03610 [Ignavibacteriae bacterium]|nr:hypothetical protein [Ignavibacteriota bacterium]
MQFLPVVRRSSALLQNAVSSCIVTPAKFTGIFSYVNKRLGGKAIWLVLLVALVFSLSYSPDSKAQPYQECGPAHPGCEWGGGIMFSMLLYL